MAKPVVLERVIETNVCDYARKLGFLVFKFKSVQNRSIPDRLLIFMGLVFFIEFKSSIGKLQKAQKLKIQEMRNSGAVVYIINDINKGRELIDSYYRLKGL
jgi:hypothetical protein